MNAIAALVGVGTLLLLPLGPSHAKPALHHAPAAPSAPAASPAAAAPSPALAVVQRFLTARQDQLGDKVFAMLSPGTQAVFPADWALPDAATLKSLPPALIPVLALFTDTHNTLHFKFRALGPSPDDPAIILVRAYQVGTPLSTVRVLQIVTAADPDVPGSLRLDGIKTATLAAPEMMQHFTAAQKATSQSHLKTIMLGIIQYAQDNNGRLPDADRWISEVTPYVQSEAMFQDPAMLGKKWGYAFNSTLSGVSLSDLDNPAATVLLFESTAGKKNATDAGESVPALGRHDGGTDYAFADGHIAWQADGMKPSFSLEGK